MTRITATLPGVFIDTELFADGWQLQSVEGWWGATDPRLDNEAREWGHGDFGQAEAFQDARFVTLSGVFQCRADPDAILAADGVLTALLNREEFPLSIAYGSRSGTVMARMASRVGWDPDHAPGAAQFEVTFKADDPRIYGVTQTASTGVPTAGVGVADPVLDPFQEGAPGNLGRVAIVNGGNAPTEPTVTVTGGLSGGFELLCIETGRVVRVTRPIPDGSQISIAMGSGEIWIDGQSPVPAQFAPVTEWMQVQPGQTCTIQFTPLGVVSGTPMMTAKWAGADW